MLSDTKPEAEKVWIELWRKATPTERLARTFRMSSWAIQRSRAALAAARPELSPRERDLWWVELNYGKPLADKVRAHLAKHDAQPRSA
jgi:hypothetical protein